MRSRPRTSTKRAILALTLLLLPLGVCAQAPKAAATSPAAPAPVIPDYGGRDSAPASAVPAATPGETGPASPLAQAWRAFESLAIVLALVVGVVFLLKRYNLVNSDGTGKARLRLPPSLNRFWTPAVSSVSGGQTEPGLPLTVLSSQPLPGGGMLHMISVADRTLLLGATAQNVTLIADWETDAMCEGAETPSEAAFAEYLSRAGVADPTPPSGRVARTRVGAASERLQSVLARSREAASEEAEL